MHESGDVDLTDRGCVVSSAVGLGHVAQGAAGAEVRDGDARLHARLFRPLEQVVRHAHERVLFHERLAVFADERQTVHVRVHADSEVSFLTNDGLAQLDQVLGQRLRIMGEIARGLAVDGYALHAQALEQARHDDAAHAVHRVQNHLEAGLLDRGQVHGLELQHGLDVLVREVVLLDRAQLIHRREIEILAGRKVQDRLTLDRREELALVVQELEGVPLARVMRSCEDDAAVRICECHGQLGRGSAGKAAFHHVHSAGDEGSADQLLHHLAADSGVPSDNHFVALAVIGRGLTARESRAVRVCKLHYVYRGEAFACRAADCSADAGDGFN